MTVERNKQRRDNLAIKVLCAMMQSGGSTWSYESMQRKAIEVTDQFLEKLDDKEERTTSRG